jgi:hypothetical protein
VMKSQAGAEELSRSFEPCLSIKRGLVHNQAPAVFRLS